MTAAQPEDRPLPPPPYAPLRGRLVALADALDRSGTAERAAELRALVETWWGDQQRWEQRLGQVLGVHHEINNALVGVYGTTQLLLRGPAAQVPEVRERLELVMRESGRIRDAAIRLREAKASIHESGPASRAA
jgi:hypothetical protein